MGVDEQRGRLGLASGVAGALRRTVPVVLQALVYYRPDPGRVAMPDIACDILWVGETLLVSGPQRRGAPSSYVGQEVVLAKIAPSIARAVLGVPLSELTDTRIPLSDVNASVAGAIHAHLERQSLRVLVGKPCVPGDERFDTAAAALRRGRRVRDAALAVALSERQLERLFLEHAGLAPAVYRRICRLHRAVRAAKAGAPLAAAAVLAGFADQPHLSREVRSLTGSSPHELLPHVGSVQDVVWGGF